MSEVLAFNKWSSEGISIEDPGLITYISLKPQYVPKTGARYAGRRFHKSKVFIVERLINKLMVPGHKGKKHRKSSGHCTGKANKVYQAVEDAFKIVEKKLNKNPVEVFVKGVENAAPREEVVTIEYGGARYPKAVECAPQRRIDVVLKLMATGTYDQCFNKKKSLAQALSDEIIWAYNMDAKSTAISKKNEAERQADASR
ncbi:30S ribosomal protein S7 [Candidatus Woesearchaeota archaeon CG10_big_fil_rev_8_21_14_0_10_30_7]|nr:MAG: 30S ribosomal protein S7 [Candidatus Woesearchaeota archaeon CG10_big_fil_rev_8_21_14_0_10_30_7]